MVYEKFFLIKMISKYWKEPEDPKTLVLSNLKVTIKELEKLIKEIEELT